MRLHIFPNQFPGSVIGSVIDEDQFELALGIVELRNTVKQFGQMVDFVSKGYNDRKTVDMKCAVYRAFLEFFRTNTEVEDQQTIQSQYDE